MAYLTNEERKLPLSHVGDYFSFESCVDLSCGVNVRPLTSYDYAKDPSLVAHDVASFTAWWAINYHRKLNGFSGMDTIKWNFHSQKQQP